MIEKVIMMMVMINIGMIIAHVKIVIMSVRLPVAIITMIIT